MMKDISGYILLVMQLLVCACSPEMDQSIPESAPVFLAKSAEESGLSFSNTILENDTVNYFSYPYLYMGGGVAIGDINQDGLQDIYFTSNMEDNKLYLNKGGMQFKDITASAAVPGDKRWDTGVCMVDVNGDNLLDIYVSVSGIWHTTRNQLFINQGDLTFSEEAKQFGLADEGQSTQATFFDFDRDGDLDVYVVNYPITQFDAPPFVYKQNHLHAKHQDSDHLYRNDRGVFTDITVEAGILNYGLGLSATSGDFNQDGWPDIYVSNDFASPDFFYFNNGDGTFTERVEESMKHTAFYGMGADVADINNDGLLDIFQADMTPEDNFRSKANMASMNPSSFNDMVNLGLHHQYMENAFQLNHGLNESGFPIFGDISRMTGTALTDWSWSPLFADFDNDGWRDLHVTNGTRRDINNKDYFKQFEKGYFGKGSEEISPLEKTLNIPSQEIDNYLFKNNGDLTFTKVTAEWGASFEGFTNGSAYGDLDNDGDLDLVTNNIDAAVSLFENKTADQTNQHYLRIKLAGPAWNSLGLDTQVKLESEGKIWFAENKNTRGFQSSSESILHFGLGALETLETVTITWFDGKQQVIKDLATNQELQVEYSQASAPFISSANMPSYWASVPAVLGVDFVHQENEFDDFAREVLLPHRTSRFGPGLAQGDINGDGLEDFFVGGAKGQAGAFFIQSTKGGFDKFQPESLAQDRDHEDIGALLFDANGDGRLDLYVVSGGSEFTAEHPLLQDRLYINTPKGLRRSDEALPAIFASGSRVKACDFDQDGDLDLLVGGRLLPGVYPMPGRTQLLVNESKNGKVVFNDVTVTQAPSLLDIGMVTDFVWSDFDQDGQTDLVVVGEWMPISFFKNDQGHFKEVTDSYGFADTRGWYFSIAAADFDADGDDDYVLGNLGLNYKYQASEEETFDVFLSDYDENGTQDIVLGYYYQGTQYPVRGRECSSQQIPQIKQKFDNYTAYASASLKDIYSGRALDKAAVHYKASSFASLYLENEAGQTFNSRPLPAAAQLSSINKILVKDIDDDGDEDILLAGNLLVSEVETKRNDASIGCMLRNRGDGQFEALSYSQSGFIASKDVKDMIFIETPSNTMVIVANNNDRLEMLKAR